MPTVCLLAGIAFCLTCAKKSETGATTDLASLPEDSLCVMASQKIIREFGKDLKGKLLSALADSGVAGAITVCRDEASEIATKHSQPGVYSIRRVSDRNRNPQNAADSEALAIMAQYADTILRHSDYVKFWRSDGEHKLFVYYQPIYTDQLCLKCHGAVDSMSAEVREALRVNYPDDKATGYEVGNLRGLFVVRIVCPEGQETARKILAEGG